MIKVHSYMLQSYGQTANTINMARLVIHFNTGNPLLSCLTQPSPFVTSAEYLLLVVHEPTTSTFYLLANESL